MARSTMWRRPLAENRFHIVVEPLYGFPTLAQPYTEIFNLFAINLKKFPLASCHLIDFAIDRGHQFKDLGKFRHFIKCVDGRNVVVRRAVKKYFHVVVLRAVMKQSHLKSPTGGVPGRSGSTTPIYNTSTQRTTRCTKKILLITPVLPEELHQ